MASPRQFLTGIDLANNRAINAASPSAGTDLANKAYVDNKVDGLTWKVDVRAATTTNGTLATAYANGQTVDGVTLATGDRILIKNQTAQSENGLYIVAASGAPTRSTDADTPTELNNATVSVLDGTVNGVGGSLNVNGTSWTQTTKNPTIGSSNIVWALYASGQTYTAGNGLQLITNAFSVLLDTNSGLAVSGTGLKVNPGSAIDTTGGNTNVKLNGTNPALTLTGGLAVIAGTGISVAANTVAVDTSIVARKFSTSVGDGSTLTYTVTHNLGTLDVIVQTYANSGGVQVEADVIHATTNTVTVGFTVAPTTNQFRVVVLG